MQLSLENDREDHSVIRHYIGMSMNQMRHLAVSRITEQHNVDSILDLGCSEGLLLQKLARNQQIRLAVGVDFDETALSSAVLNTFPENIQQSIQFRREEDQHVFIYRADATKKYHQLKQKRAKLVTLVELIEHLPIQDVPKAVDNVFGYLQPQLCFISTPNQEFNVFFDLSEGQMRHWDHKFQWKRDQFKSFCQGIKQKYGYQFTIGGIGQHISDESKGHCTQYALFTRPNSLKLMEIDQKESNIQLQDSGLQQQLQQRAHYENKSWHNNLEKIIMNTLFKSLYYDADLTLEEGVQFIMKEPIGQCLIKKGQRIDREYLVSWLQKLQNDFQWNQERYRTKKTHQQPDKMDQLVQS